MKVKDYRDYALFDYNSIVGKQDDFQLGDIVINDENKIGVIIQVHEPSEFRVDMFGNCGSDEIRLASEEEVKEYRLELLENIPYL